jgi:pimeloyl-[acyl-carrier protein] methyl ester esterase
MSSKQILLIPGWGMNKAIWHQVEKAFKNKLIVNSVNLPSYGQSENSLKEYSLTSLANKLAHYLDNADQTILLGWSLGGLVAIEMAKLYPKKISQLILVATNPKFIQSTDWQYAVEEKIFLNFADQLKRNIGKTIKRFIAIQAMGTPTAKEDIKIIQKLIETNDYADYDTLSKGLDILLSADQRQTLLSLTLPTLMIMGNRDNLVKVQGLKNLCKFQSNKSNHLSLEIIENAGHAPFISHFKVFVAMIEKTLNPDKMHT